jgi:hypothetical protein
MIGTTMVAAPAAMMPTEKSIENTHDELLMKIDLRVRTRQGDITSKRNQAYRFTLMLSATSPAIPLTNSMASKSAYLAILFNS